MNENTKRRRSRELALQVLFQKEFVPDVDSEISLNYFCQQMEVPPESLHYAQKILAGIEEHKEVIDAKISEKSRNWKIPRMAPVDLSLLRIGVMELLFHNDVPGKVVIDEALEIAKRYGGNESTQFINGILDEVYKTTQN